DMAFSLEECITGTTAYPGKIHTDPSPESRDPP
ncbi:hypothetical protein NPIL_234401, partial [Nephila pilipes]